MDVTLVIGTVTAVLTYVVLRAGRVWKACAAVVVLAVAGYGLIADTEPVWLVPFLIGAGLAFVADTLVTLGRALRRPGEAAQREEG